MCAGRALTEHLGSDLQWHLECASTALPLGLISYSPSGPASWNDVAVSNSTPARPFFPLMFTVFLGASGA